MYSAVRFACAAQQGIYLKVRFLVLHNKEYRLLTLLKNAPSSVSTQKRSLRWIIVTIMLNVFANENK